MGRCPDVSSAIQLKSKLELCTLPLDTIIGFSDTRRLFTQNLFALIILSSVFSIPLILEASNQTEQANPPETVSRNPVDYETARFSRIVTAVRTTDEIIIDGVLNEAGWATGLPAKDFTQFEPSPGMPATEPTEVYFLYDDNNLYVGAICFQAERSPIIATELQKDFGTTDNDGIAVILDSLHDLQSGFTFGTNPIGAKFEAQAMNDGGTMNRTWDGVWDVQVSIHDDRWIAEFMIPFKTVRFTNESSQEWGINIRRRVRSKNEDSHWSPIPTPL